MLRICSATRQDHLGRAVALALACAMQAVPSPAMGQPSHPSEVLPRERWPSSVRAAVTDILGKMKDDEKARLREMKRSDLAQLQDGWGTAIRNHYGLWRGNQALTLSACGEPCHPEEASLVIMEATWQTLQSK